MAVELNGKRLGPHEEIAPDVSRGDASYEPDPSCATFGGGRSQRVAGALGISLQYLQVRDTCRVRFALSRDGREQNASASLRPDNLIMSRASAIWQRLRSA